MTDQSSGGAGVKRTRARLARSILVVAAVALVLGIAVNVYQSRTADPWRERIMRGEPVGVQFLCGVKPAVDCKTVARITYQKQDSKWCASQQADDQTSGVQQSWCNANPERGTISVSGVVYSFDRFGLVMNGDRLVGRLLRG